MKTFTLILLPNDQRGTCHGETRRYTATARNRTRDRRMAEQAAGPLFWVAICEEVA